MFTKQKKRDEGLSQLPVEVVMLISTHLGYSDICHLSATSKRFHLICGSNWIWKRKCLLDFDMENVLTVLYGDDTSRQSADSTTTDLQQDIEQKEWHQQNQNHQKKSWKNTYYILHVRYMRYYLDDSLRRSSHQQQQQLETGLDKPRSYSMQLFKQQQQHLEHQHGSFNFSNINCVNCSINKRKELARNRYYVRQIVKTFNFCCHHNSNSSWTSISEGTMMAHNNNNNHLCNNNDSLNLYNVAVEYSLEASGTAMQNFRSLLSMNAFQVVQNYHNHHHHN